MPPAFFIVFQKNAPPIENQNIRTAYGPVVSYCLYAVSFFCCIDFSVGRLFPLPSAFLVQT